MLFCHLFEKQNGEIALCTSVLVSSEMARHAISIGRTVFLLLSLPQWFGVYFGLVCRFFSNYSLASFKKCDDFFFSCDLYVRVISMPSISTGSDFFCLLYSNWQFDFISIISKWLNLSDDHYWRLLFFPLFRSLSSRLFIAISCIYLIENVLERRKKQTNTSFFSQLSTSFHMIYSRNCWRWWQVHTNVKCVSPENQIECRRWTHSYIRRWYD